MVPKRTGQQKTRVRVAGEAWCVRDVLVAVSTGIRVGRTKGSRRQSPFLVTRVTGRMLWSETKEPHVGTWKYVACSQTHCSMSPPTPTPLQSRLSAQAAGEDTAEKREKALRCRAC